MHTKFNNGSRKQAIASYACHIHMACSHFHPTIPTHHHHHQNMGNTPVKETMGVVRRYMNQTVETLDRNALTDAELRTAARELREIIGYWQAWEKKFDGPLSKLNDVQEAQK